VLTSLMAPPRAAPVDEPRAGMCTRDLSAWYGERKAIEDISLAVAAHHITAIIGPSGCGKSTFIRCLNRMHEVVRGARASGRAG
jgi:phosphate transport system ATP-binding protein